MIDCQLATGSEPPQLGGEQQHQLPHLLLNWKGALLAYNCLIVLSSLLLLLLYLGNLSTTTQRIFSIKGGAHPPFPLSFFRQNDFLLRGRAHIT